LNDLTNELAISVQDLEDQYGFSARYLDHPDL
jgi:hypothetical protein